MCQAGIQRQEGLYLATIDRRPPNLCGPVVRTNRLFSDREPPRTLEWTGNL